ncbi:MULTISPECIES: hypothetical protein [Streptomyces]|uniref:Uncharacterized protein n=1 Tax=Streptomyces siderophoricus TaxID=2802281 RepID=A0ABS1MT50_9ACTN|nr:hypothetical protein [Streptomyces sp. 9-7]MBL1090930.1 hypothetical protein [Streptomyces sp. 9-7]
MAETGIVNQLHWFPAELMQRVQRAGGAVAGRIIVLDGRRRTVPAVPSGGPSAWPVEGRDDHRDECIREQR